MATPHMTKNSTISVSETVTRNGHHSRFKRTIEEESEDDSHHSMQEAADVDEPANSQQSTASALSGDKMAKLVYTMLDKQHQQHSQQKKTIHKKYTASKASVQETITGLFNEQEAQCSTAHDTQLTRLRQLLARKADIEATMARKLSELKVEYAVHCHDLQRVAEHRVKALR